MKRGKERGDGDGDEGRPQGAIGVGRGRPEEAESEMVQNSTFLEGERVRLETGKSV